MQETESLFNLNSVLAELKWKLWENKIPHPCNT